MNGLSTAHWLTSSKTTLRRATAAMLVFGRVRTVRARSGLVRAATDTRLTLERSIARSHAAIARFAAAVVEHRHGTWLLLFATLFTALWLLVGWIGMGNGLLRGLLVGILTPLLVNALFPLKRASR